MKKQEAFYISVGFFDLICDASFAHFKSKDSVDDYEQNRFSRASIISTALCVEAFANCLLGSLSLPKRTFSELDRLPTLGKIDIYLKLNGLNLLERSKKEVQKINDLIRLRNDFVHVKPSNVESEIRSGRIQSLDKPVFDFTMKPKFYEAIEICKLALAWRSNDSLAALCAASDFFRYVYSKLNVAQTKELRNSLVSKIGFSDAAMPHFSDPYILEIERLQSVGADFTMLLSREQDFE